MPCTTGCRTILQAPAPCQHRGLVRSCSVQLHLKHLAGSPSANRTHLPARPAMRSASSLQAFRKPLSHRSDERSYDSNPVVDTTAEEVSTSGQSSDDNRDQQHKPNILRRAATAAIGFVSAFYNWLKSNARLKRLLNRSLPFTSVEVYLQFLHACC